MNSTAERAGPAPARRLARNADDRLVAGVLAGIANRLGIDPILTRVCFVVLVVATGGIALIAYAVGWLAMPSGDATRSRLPGLGVRPGGWRLAAGAAFLTLAGLLVFRELGLWWSDALVWPLVLAAAGAALLWRQSQAPTSERPQRGRGARPDTVPPDTEGASAGAASQVAGIYRGGFGIALVVGAALLFLYANGALEAASDAALAAVVTLAALALVLAPFLWRLARNLTAERTERIRSQERAELAAHLHDSVLQTLALMQKQADDPRRVATLARRQERELRRWLSGTRSSDGGSGLAGALEAAAAEVEDARGVAVDAVLVGDATLDERSRALVAATREALVNAAKFAPESGPVALYAEVTPERAQVFVRDRGPGFDVDSVPADRHGVRESIIGRMHRHGGEATIRSGPDGGTEVELSVEVEGAPR
jgi:signal transduction histidine kinase/phage shock protein PspC (stress-responsive transcriptional regulator)